jgi:hypothetical protein
MAPPAAPNEIGNPMVKTNRPAHSDKLTSIELATEHLVDDHVVAILERSRMECPRRIVEAQ